MEHNTQPLRNIEHQTEADLRKMSHDIREVATYTQEAAKNSLKHFISNLRELIEVQENALKRLEGKKTEYRAISAKIQEQIDNLIKQKQIKEIEVSKGVGDIQLREKAKELNTEYIAICRERIAAAKEIDVKNLKLLDIKDRQSIANEMFKWVLVVIFKEPISHYYWPNFRKQVFEKDDGKYFIDKLGKQSALTASYEDEYMTENLIDQFEAIKSSPEMEGHLSEAENFLTVIKCFRKGYKMGKQLFKIDDEIGRLVEIYEMKNKQLKVMKNLLNGFKNRMRANEQFMSAVKEMQSIFFPKISEYCTKIIQAQKLLGKISEQNLKLTDVQREEDIQDCRLF